MAAVTFGSFGDIIAVCNILITAANALSDSKGSKADYQKLIAQLECLKSWDKAIVSLLEDYPRLRYNVQLQDLICACKDHLDRYTKRIELFRNSLGNNPSASTINQICRKLRWLSQKVRGSFQPRMDICGIVLTNKFPGRGFFIPEVNCYI